MSKYDSIDSRSKIRGQLATFFVKRFLIPLLVVLALPTTVEANWFGYGSRYEAYRACQRWKSNKKSLSCRDDKETNQVLGLKNFSKVKKRFKY